MRRIRAYQHYYKVFIDSLTQEEQAKIRRSLALLKTNDRIPRHFINYMGDAIYEFRITLRNKEARLFFVYGDEDLIVLLNCFIKKTKRTPPGEFEKAKRLKKAYDESR